MTSVAAKPPTPGLSARDLELRAKWETYLDPASEDDFTEKVLFPLLLRLGFQRVSNAGHQDKALEYGRDLWMKLCLPTGHWIYFGIQVKQGKIDSAARSRRKNDNVSELMNQLRMALDANVWDPDINRTILVDHVYVVASGEITKAARQLLGTSLDRASRRHIIFMDRGDVLNLVSKVGLATPWEAGVTF